ncbi:MAG: hypothetical protein R8G66_24730 [Cytophagales bacterium]|nr:hypothetical protein [Cytophagales bacterium]
MEFEEMQKIWDNQNQRPLYAIDEDALRRRIHAKSRKASLASNVNEIGLIAISIITFIIIVIKNIGNDNPYAYPPVIILLLTSVYIYIGRIKRKKKESQFDRTMLGELDHALYNSEYEIRRARTFPLWYLIPVSIPAMLNMYMNDASITKWVLVLFAFTLSYVVVWFGLTKMQEPRKRKLEKLREKILTDDWGDGT